MTCRKKTLVLALALSASTALTPAMAQTRGNIADAIVSQLTDQGFIEIEISRTLLGRTRIEARSDQFKRELVVNSRTGEILRDYWESLDDDDVPKIRIADPKASDGDEDESGGESGSSGGGNSGSGGGNSGSGGGNSGSGGGGNSGSGGGNSGSGGGGGSGSGGQAFNYLDGGQGRDVDFA